MKWRSSGRIAILVLVAVATTIATAGTVGLTWNPADGAEGYRVYWRTPSGSYSAAESTDYPVCGGNYDPYPPSLVPGVTCVDRENPVVDAQDIPEAAPLYLIAAKAYNEAGYSVEFSNEVRKNNVAATPPTAVRRSEAPPVPDPN